MKKSKKVSLIIAIALVILLLFYWWSGNNKPKAPPPVSVTVSTVLQKDVVVKTKQVGTVESPNSISVRTLVDGAILKVSFTEGDIVKTGQVLFEIDPRPAQSQLQQAQANLARDQANLVNARRTQQRNVALLKRGFIAQKDYEDLVASAKSLEGTVKADLAAIENAKVQLGYTIIRAPIDGKTGDILTNIGNLAKITDTNPLVVINQIQPIYISFSLPEEYLDEVQAHMKRGEVPLTAVIENNGTEAGKLFFVDNAINTATGTILLKGTFPNPQMRLWPGQYVTVEVPVREFPQGLLIPTEAIQIGQQGTFVYVVEDNKAKVRAIKAGPAVGENTVVLEGLKPGEKVVTSGQLRLIDGAAVTIQP